MRSFIAVLKTPNLRKTGKLVPEMDTTMTVEYHGEVFRKQMYPPHRLHLVYITGIVLLPVRVVLLTDMNMVLMVAPFQVGLSLSMWTKSMHYMIQKVKKQYVTKLHIVQLYKADFNTMLKRMLRKRIMHHSEVHNINGHQLFGSRKGKSTYDTLVTVLVIYDMARGRRDCLISMLMI